MTKWQFGRQTGHWQKANSREAWFWIVFERNTAIWLHCQNLAAHGGHESPLPTAVTRARNPARELIKIRYLVAAASQNYLFKLGLILGREKKSQ